MKRILCLLLAFVSLLLFSDEMTDPSQSSCQQGRRSLDDVSAAITRLCRPDSDDPSIQRCFQNAKMVGTATTEAAMFVLPGGAALSLASKTTLVAGRALSGAKAISRSKGFSNLAMGTTTTIERGMHQIWSSTPSRTSVQNAFKHWKDHGNEFQGLYNSKQYVEHARFLLKDSEAPGNLHKEISLYSYPRKPRTRYDKVKNRDQRSLSETDDKKILHTNSLSEALVKYRINGEMLRYNPTNNTFGAFTKEGIPKTMFKPLSGETYWYTRN